MGQQRARARAWLLGAAIALATIFLGARAEAGMIQVSAPTIQRATSDAGAQLARGPGAQDFVSYQDCLDNVAIDFPVSASDASGGSDLQVWVSSNGADCTEASYRAGVGETCTQVAASGLPASGVVSIFAQQLVDRAFGIQGCVDTTGQYWGPGKTGPQPVSIYFLLIDQGDPIPAGAYVKWTSTQVDLLGPAAPGGVSITPGEDAITVELPPLQDPDTLGYLVFCNPPPNSGGGPVLIDGGAGGEGCPSGLGIPISDPQPQGPSLLSQSPFLCGVTSSRTISVAAHDPGQTVAVAVAAYDEADNIGALTAPMCASPEAGGAGGGGDTGGGEPGGTSGGCAITAPGAGGDAGWATLAALSLATANAVRRRARSCAA